MAMSQEGNLFAPRMILFITKVEDEKRLEELLDDLNIPIFYQ